MQWLGILLAHLVGDYILQSHWMAVEKTSKWAPAIAHGVTYTLPYAILTQSPLALFVIFATHVIIDRFRLAKWVVWFKNQLAPYAYRPTIAEAAANSGYPAGAPAFLSVWLMIIADNTIHLLINTIAVAWL